MSEEILDQTPQEESPPLPPAVRMVIEDYNPEDAQHYAQWLASGQPDSPWQTTWYEDLQGDGETYVRRAQPEANPVTDVDRAIGNFKQARLAAPEALDRLKGTVWAALVAGGMAPDEATAAGVGLVLLHGPLLAAFEAAGGHPVAGQALYDAIASKPSTDALPWLTKGILEVFAAALLPQ